MTDSAIISLPSSLFVCPFICAIEYDDGLEGLSQLYQDIQKAFSFKDTMEFMAAELAIKQSIDRRLLKELIINKALYSLIEKSVNDRDYGLDMSLWLLKLHTRVGYGKTLFKPGVFLLLNEDYASTGATIVPRPIKPIL